MEILIKIIDSSDGSFHDDEAKIEGDDKEIRITYGFFDRSVTLPRKDLLKICKMFEDT